MRVLYPLLTVALTLATPARAREAQDPVDRAVVAGRRTVERFFGGPYPKNFTVSVFPDRESLTRHWREAWKAPDLKPECWMVASGTAEEIDILSPSVWKTQACEHDPTDTRATRMLIAHELVHVFHGQSNPRPDFDGMDPVSWFVEGLAVYVSGQLETLHARDARAALDAGIWPEDLESVWSGKYRYGLAGSLVAHVAATHGRERLKTMLRGTTEAELLGMLGLSETGLLDRWRQSVAAPPAASSSRTPPGR